MEEHKVGFWALSCAEPGAGRDDPCGSVPTQDILGHDTGKPASPSPIQVMG